MTQEKKNVTLFYTVERSVELPVKYFSQGVLVTSQLLDRFDEGVLLIAVHNRQTSIIHFDQAGPCHLLEFDEKGQYAGTHPSRDGRGPLFSCLVQGRYLLLRTGLPDEQDRPRSLTADMLPPALLETYLTTRYIVKEAGINIRIGQKNPQLDALLQEHGTERWAFITAYNPGSQRTPAAENEARHQELEEALQGYHFFEGEGQGDDPDWLAEQSLLVLGIDGTEAEAVGRRFGQNAIVAGSLEGVPQLRVLTG